MKRLMLFLLICPMVLLVHAQWTVKDSLNLNRLLKGKEEIKLNMDVVKQIDFDHLLGQPGMVKDKPGLKYDETLPQVLEKKKVVLTLHPYNARTKYNWDPVYQRKIKVEADTWQISFTEMMPSNWARNIADKGIRRSLEEIRATGLRENILGERANGMMIRSYSTVPSVGMKVGNRGVTVNGGAIGGLNLMGILEKDFWDKKGRTSRARTLEVLKAYGDSTTVLVPHPILEPIAR